MQMLPDTPETMLLCALAKHLDEINTKTLETGLNNVRKDFSLNYDETKCLVDLLKERLGVD